MLFRQVSPTPQISIQRSSHELRLDRYRSKMKLVLLFTLIAVAQSKTAANGHAERAASLANAHVDELCNTQECLPGVGIDCRRCVQECMMTRFPDAFRAVFHCIFHEQSRGCETSEACVRDCHRQTVPAEKVEVFFPVTGRGVASCDSKRRGNVGGE